MNNKHHLKPNYTHVFFDLDDTLWDYRANSNKTLVDLYDKYRFKDFGLFSQHDFTKIFHEVNKELWQGFNSGVIEKSIIRSQRFERIFDRLGLNSEYRPHQISKDFGLQCPFQTEVVEGAFEILRYLNGKGYFLGIITNGFEEVQQIKLHRSGLNRFFRQVVTSDSSDARKPSAKIFEYALYVCNASYDSSIMIGDNYLTDIQGAMRVDLDCIHYNPNGDESSSNVLQISDLLDLRKYL